MTKLNLRFRLKFKVIVTRQNRRAEEFYFKTMNYKELCSFVEENRGTFPKISCEGMYKELFSLHLQYCEQWCEQVCTNCAVDEDIELVGVDIKIDYGDIKHGI